MKMPEIGDEFPKFYRSRWHRVLCWLRISKPLQFRIVFGKAERTSNGTISVPFTAEPVSD